MYFAWRTVEITVECAKAMNSSTLRSEKKKGALEAAPS